MTEEKNILSLYDEIQSFHTEWKLCGRPRNALFKVSNNLLFYVLSLLRNERPFLPEAPLNEWIELLTLLNSHWILPTLYWKINCLPQNLHPPEEVIDQLRKSFMISHVRYLHMERQLAELMDIFQKAGIRVLVIKGPALAYSVYPNPATRSFSDIDLLMRPEQFLLAREVLLNNGYRCQCKMFESFKDFHCEEMFLPRRKSKHIYCVELHWAQHVFLGNERGNTIEDLFCQAVKVETPTLSYETLNLVDTFIHSALHLIMAHPKDMRLNWVYDIALLARGLHVPDDWIQLQKRCAQWGARLAVEQSFTIAQMWTNLQLPKGFENFSSWPKPAEVERAAIKNTLQRHDRPDIYWKLCLAHSSSPIKKILISLRILFPHPDFMRQKYTHSATRYVLFLYFRYWWSWFVRSWRYIKKTIS